MNNSTTVFGPMNNHPDDVANVLIVDRDNHSARVLLPILARRGIRGNLARSEKSAAQWIEERLCDLVFAAEDLLCPGGFLAKPAAGSDTTLLHKIKTYMPELPVVAVASADARTETALSPKTVAAAVEAVKRGCCDYLLRPLDVNKIEATLNTIFSTRPVGTLAGQEVRGRCLYRIVGKSAKLRHTVELASKVAPTSVPVLITGESGTGKELISYLIHQKSNRSNGPYVKVNCAALSESLLESELFGHEKGAFTGAYCRRVGRFERANGGTLLLDEISETPIRFQAKLLRVLEQQDFERVGGSNNIAVNVRIISTTNKDLLEEVRCGRFRRDLYYRLSGLKLVVSPLRQRPEDLSELVWYFVNLYAGEARRRITHLDPAMMELFAKYHWPGNVRQLRNVVRSCLLLGTGETLSLADVSWLLDAWSPQQAGLSSPQADAACAGTEPPAAAQLRCGRLGGVPLELLERQAIIETLQQTRGNQTRAAKVLGISDRTLRDKVKRYRQQGCLQSI